MGFTYVYRLLKLGHKACTFLGPSKKRGPPKGYIDAIEARLHQTEALLGVLLGSQDERAVSLLRDLAQVWMLPLCVIMRCLILVLG